MIDFLAIWGSYLYFPFAAYCVWKLIGAKPLSRLIICFVMVVPTLLAYGRFIEPRQLVVKHHAISLSERDIEPHHTPTLKVALFADTHFGIFPNAIEMKRIVNRINALGELDAVLIAGDFTYYPTQEQIKSQVKALSDLQAPVYAVLGNHDVGRPGPDLTTPIVRELNKANVTLVENRAFELEDKPGIYIAGASDLWQRRQNFSFSSGLPDTAIVLLLTHNPDTAIHVPAVFDYDLMLAGHTHGGQVRLPFIYKDRIPTSWPFDIGLHNFPSKNGDKSVFVTPGTGMVGLPFRFMMPPRIDVIDIYTE